MMKIVTLCAAGVALAFSASAEITATQVVERVVVTTTEDGSQTESLVQAETVVPGELLAYSLSWENESADPAENVVITMPVPAEVTYVEGSADVSGTIVTFSADDGQTFSARNALTVTTADTIKSAVADDITHVRWTFADAVAADANGAVTFRAVLN